MVVRLKDIRAGQTSKEEPKKSGVVRLKDIREQKINEEIKINRIVNTANREKFGPINTNFMESPTMQRITGIQNEIPPQELQSPAHNNVPRNAAKISNVEKNKNKASRNLYMIGGVLSDLDKMADYPIVNKVADFARSFTGAGVTGAGVSTLTGGAEKLVEKVAPKLASSITGRIAKKAATEAIAGAPLGVAQSLATGHDDKEVLMGGVYGAALGGGLGGVASGVAAAAKGAVNSAATKLMGDIFQQVKKDTKVSPVKLKVSSSEEAFQSVAPKIFKDAAERMTPPLENETALAKWVQTHLNEAGHNVSMNEVKKLGYETLRKYSDDIVKEFNLPAAAKQSAEDLGYGKIYNKETPTIKQVQAADESSRAYGFPAPKVEIQRENFKGPSTNEFPASPSEVAPHSKIKRLADIRQEAVAKESVIPENANGKPLNIESANPQPIKLSNEEIKRSEDARTFNDSGLGDSGSFEGKITRGKKASKTTFGEKWEKLKTQFTEDIAPINKLERNVKGEISSAEDSIYKSARLYKGVPEKINQFIEQRLKPIVRTIEKAGHHSDDLGRYALAVHAKDVNKAGIKSGFTNAEIDDVLKKFGTPEMEAARKELVNINKELLDDLVDSGVVSKEMRDSLNERWKNYIPLTRDLDDVVGRSSGLSEALANVASPIKRLKGSEKNVVEPLENMVENIVKNINASERNKVASHIPKLAKLDPDEKFIRKLKDGEKIEGKNVVSVKENGENVHYEVDKDVHDALLTLDKESSTWLMRFLSTPASWLRAGATLTPEFIIRNPIRDYRNAKIVSESGFRLDDYAVGLASSLMGKFGKGKLYQDWVKNLGAYGNIVSEDRNAFVAAQKKVLTQSATKKFINVVNPKSIITLLRSISDISESSTKVGEYRAALRKGATKEEAAYRARDIMDFARAGTSIRQTNKVVAFLNANIQGKSKMIRAFKKNPVRTSIRVFKSMAVPTVGIYYYNKQFANDEQKETIKNAPNWQRNTFWLVAVPGTDMVARIPKPFDFAVVSNIVDRSLELFDNHDKEAFDNFGKGVVADNALPMMITGIQPILEGMANYSFFRQGPIIPERDKGVGFDEQYDPIRTSETAKGIAKGVESVAGSMGGNFRSPYIVDNTIQGLFAGGGNYATDAVDAILGKTGAVDRPKAPEKSTEQKPILRSFLIDPNQGGKATEQLYDLKTKLTKTKGSASRKSEEFKEAPKLKYVTDQTDAMGEIGKEIRTIEKDMKLSPKQKRDQIDVLVKTRNEIAMKAMDYIKSKND